jgi:hypothetical protein
MVAGKEGRKIKRRAAGSNPFGPRKTGNFKSSLKKVQVAVAPDYAITAKGMAVLNQIIVSVLKRIVDEAVNLARYGGHKRIKVREIQTATGLVLRRRGAGQITGSTIVQHAVSEGIKAVQLFVKSAQTTTSAAAAAVPAPDAEIQDGDGDAETGSYDGPVDENE